MRYFIAVLVCLALLAGHGITVRAASGQGRPFSWYYPYEYQYYTPHRTPERGDGCEWVYVDGAYVYLCSD